MADAENFPATPSTIRLSPSCRRLITSLLPDTQRDPPDAKAVVITLRHSSCSILLLNVREWRLIFLRGFRRLVTSVDRLVFKIMSVSPRWGVVWGVVGVLAMALPQQMGDFPKKRHGASEPLF